MHLCPLKSEKGGKLKVRDQRCVRNEMEELLEPFCIDLVRAEGPEAHLRILAPESRLPPAYAS